MKLFTTLLLLVLISSCSSDANVEKSETQNPETEPITEETAEIDSNWNYYYGTAGMYDSQIIMELNFNDKEVKGSYWYAKHKKRLNLTGSFHEKDQSYELTESYKGKTTGKIKFSIDGNNLTGRWYTPKSTGEGETFYCTKVKTNAKEHLVPKFNEYIMDHQVEIYDDETDSFINHEASDFLSVVALGTEHFVFIYDVIGHNYHTGTIEGTGKYITPGLGQFKGDEGCVVEFKFYKDSVILDANYECSYYGGARAYFGGTLIRKKK
jgi:hypothetical protein